MHELPLDLSGADCHLHTWVSLTISPRSLPQGNQASELDYSIAWCDILHALLLCCNNALQSLTLAQPWPQISHKTSFFSCSLTNIALHPFCCQDVFLMAIQLALQQRSRAITQFGLCVATADEIQLPATRPWIFLEFYFAFPDSRLVSEINTCQEWDKDCDWITRNQLANQQIHPVGSQIRLIGNQYIKTWFESFVGDICNTCLFERWLYLQA